MNVLAKLLMSSAEKIVDAVKMIASIAKCPWASPSNSDKTLKRELLGV